MLNLNEQLQPSQILRLPLALYTATQVDGLEQASFIQVNAPLLRQLGLACDRFLSRQNLELLAGRHHSENGISALATAYAGHQFGIYTSRLGDGRVHILGDLRAEDGKNWELQLKGAGPTPFARGNNGRLYLDEALTEYLGSEALHGLGIASTRGLAILSSRQDKHVIYVRMAHSHLRFGHFEYLHNQGEHEQLKQLCDHVIEEYFPELHGLADDSRYLEFLYAVTRNTAELIAAWQAAGFLHGVMNTDNMSILGLSLDLGVYGFMQAYDPAYCSNEQDDTSRYAYDQQVEVGRWNCLALAEALVELLPGRRVPARTLSLYGQHYRQRYLQLMRNKLGLLEAVGSDTALIKNLLQGLHQHSLDYSRFFRWLCHYPEDTQALAQTGLYTEKLSEWLQEYEQRLCLETAATDQRRQLMLQHNPRFILRDDLRDMAIHEAERNNLHPLHDLLTVLRSPCDEHHALSHLA